MIQGKGLNELLGYIRPDLQQYIIHSMHGQGSSLRVQNANPQTTMNCHIMFSCVYM